MWFRTKVIGSLEKVLCKRELDADELSKITALRGETVSFQVAMQAEYPVFVECTPTNDSAFQEKILIREVRQVPCYHPAKPEDSLAISHEPGLFPDPLFALHSFYRISRQNWHSLWVNIPVPEDAKAGIHTISLQISTRGDGDDGYQNEIRVVSLSVNVIDMQLPKTQDLRFTNWLFVDSILQQYKVECWSEDLWTLLKRYFTNMAEHGTNMALTPLWTLPLDVEVGKDRPTCQLLIIHDDGDGNYMFDFSLLERWIDTATQAGIETFEMSHAYTQWGAISAPKIMIDTPRGQEQRFGWHAQADSDLYRDFLSQLMPELINFLREKKLHGRCYFHVSDEPTLRDFKSYESASRFFQGLVQDFPIIDAMSNVEFYQKKITEIPVPSTHSLREFLKQDIKERWCYYCSGNNYMPNRYIGLPSLRNRIIGLFLFIYNMNGGFLHWGYNAWSTRMLWISHIDVFSDTDWGRYSESGSPFLVYPGENGPIDSLRHEVFHDAVQDYRILRLLEHKLGREKVMELIHEDINYQISFDLYPIHNGWFMAMRERLANALNA